jgi:hypothetical protein
MLMFVIFLNLKSLLFYLGSFCGVLSYSQYSFDLKISTHTNIWIEITFIFETSFGFYSEMKNL